MEGRGIEGVEQLRQARQAKLDLGHRVSRGRSALGSALIKGWRFCCSFGPHAAGEGRRACPVARSRASTHRMRGQNATHTSRACPTCAAMESHLGNIRDAWAARRGRGVRRSSLVAGRPVAPRSCAAAATRSAKPHPLMRADPSPRAVLETIASRLVRTALELSVLAPRSFRDIPCRGSRQQPSGPCRPRSSS